MDHENDINHPYIKLLTSYVWKIKCLLLVIPDVIYDDRNVSRHRAIYSPEKKYKPQNELIRFTTRKDRVVIRYDNKPDPMTFEIFEDIIILYNTYTDKELQMSYKYEIVFIDHDIFIVLWIDDKKTSISKMIPVSKIE